MMKCERVALQDLNEFDAFINVAVAEKVTSYLEVGCKHGGSLWRMAMHLPKGSRIVGVDLPHGDHSFKNSKPNLEECVRELNARGRKAHLFLGDSTSPAIIDKVAALAPFDLCFIDANHTEPFVRADWANYGPMARMVAFHDIAWVDRPMPPGKMPIQVQNVWNEIKTAYRWREISQGTGHNGIGILWKH